MIICLDPGHGGNDPGAVSKGIKEADLNLKIAHRAGSLLENYFTVIFTRNRNENVGLQQRVKIANRNKADIFVSIHCNAFKNEQVSGLEVYCLDRNPATRGNVLAKELYKRALVYSQVEGYYYKPRGVKQAGFYVIRKTIMPAVLIECGFITNTRERNWLISPRGQITLGYAIAQAIISYFEKYGGK